MKRSPNARTSSLRSLQVERLEPRWMLAADLGCDIANEEPACPGPTDAIQPQSVVSQLAPPLEVASDMIFAAKGADVPNGIAASRPETPLWTTAPRHVTSPIGAPPMGAIAESTNELLLPTLKVDLPDLLSTDPGARPSLIVQWRGPVQQSFERAPTAMTGDVDGDGLNELVSFDEGLWWIDSNHNGVRDALDTHVRLGTEGGSPVLHDFDNDGRDELGIVRPGRALCYANAEGLAAGDPVTELAATTIPAEQLSARLLDQWRTQSEPTSKHGVADLQTDSPSPYVASDSVHDARR